MSNGFAIILRLELAVVKTQCKGRSGSAVKWRYYRCKSHVKKNVFKSKVKDQPNWHLKSSPFRANSDAFCTLTSSLLRDISASSLSSCPLWRTMAPFLKGWYLPIVQDKATRAVLNLLVSIFIIWVKYVSFTKADVFLFTHLPEVSFSKLMKCISQ